jgi:multicomponent Na+:H+ antiporter subunit B
VGGPCLAALIVIGALGLPPFGTYLGPYGDILNAVTPDERQIQNVVTGINFDYRGLDTLGEEYILFAAVAAAALLLRRSAVDEDEQEQQGPQHPNQQTEPLRDRNHPGEAVHLWGLGVIASTLLFGVYMVFHAVTSPGGGFQGGCVLASAWVVVFLTGDRRLLERVTSQPIVQLTEAVGAGIYAATGIGMLALGGVFLQNLIPLGTLGSPLAGGMIQIINAGVGLEVTSGFVLILLEFLRQTDEIPDRSAESV